MFEALIEAQKKQLLKVAKRIVPNVTEDDLMQPNDFPALELHPYFRYEEGVLDGLRAAEAAFNAFSFEKSLASASSPQQ